MPQLKLKVKKPACNPLFDNTHYVLVEPETFDPKPTDQWRHLLQGAFGIFQAQETVIAVFRFTPFRARWIKEQIWHPDQTMTHLDDGGLELSLPVAPCGSVD